MWPFFLISSLVLGLLVHLQIFWQLYLIELLGLLTGLLLLKLQHLVYPRPLTGFGIVVFFTNLSLMEFQVRYMASFLLFSVIDGLDWFWMGSLTRICKDNAGVPQGSILALRFYYYALMTFLMLLSVILLSMLIILLSIRFVAATRMGFQTLIWSTIHRTGTESGLLISMPEELTWFRLTGPTTLVLLMWKWMGLFLSKNHLLKCWGWLFFLNRIEALTLFLLLKLPPRKFKPWFILWSFFLLRLLCISINLPYAHACNTVVTSKLVPLVATRNC